MQLTVRDEQHIYLDTAAGGDDFAVEGGGFGPLQMLASSLALCTASVIHSYAETAHLDVFGLAVEVRWEYVEDPHRVGRFDITLHLPKSMPAVRHRAIIRAADTCAVHQTLHHSPAFATRIETLEHEPVHEHHQHHHHHHHDEHEPES